MTDPTLDDPPRARLACLGGGEAPPELARDIARLAGLPRTARERLWEALGPSLSEPLPAPVEQLLDGFCRRHEVPGDELARVLKACRFLIREASRIDLPRAAFAEDLAALGAASEVQQVLLAGYERGKAAVRGELLHDALAAHGKVLTGVDWRVDTVAASTQGAKLQAPVVMLTLHYEDAGRRERITLQAVPGALEELRKVCDQLLGR